MFLLLFYIVQQAYACLFITILYTIITISPNTVHIIPHFKSGDELNFVNTVFFFIIKSITKEVINVSIPDVANIIPKVFIALWVGLFKMNIIIVFI